MNEKIRSLLHKLSRKANSVVEEEETIKANISEISNCLTSISANFLQCKNLEDTLTSVPEAGQLIGRLCSSSYILGNADLNDRLMKCLLALLKDQTASSLEMKARIWGLDKIRCMQRLEDNDLSLGCGLELNYSDLVHQYLTGAVRIISSHLSTTANVTYTNGNKPSEDEMSNRLLSITSLLLCSPQTELFSKICEEMLDILRNGSLTNTAKIICEKLTDHLKWSAEQRETHLYLSDSALLKLYRIYRPALEQEMLLTIQACCQSKLKSDMSEIIGSRPLHKMAVCNDSILNECVHMLQGLYFETGSCMILQFASTFCMCMQKYRLKYHREVEIPFWTAYPSNLKQIAVSLSKFTPGIKEPLIEEELKTIYTSLVNINQNERLILEDMMSYFLLNSFSACYFQTLKILLNGDKKLMDCSLGILCFYHGIHKEIWQKTIELMRNLVTCLRPLMTKSSLSEADLMCALSPTVHATETDKSLCRLIRHILLTFMFYSTDGIRLTEQILKLANISVKTEDLEGLVILLNLHEDLEIDFSIWPVDKLQFYKSYIGCMIDKTEQTESNSKVISSGSSFIKENFHIS